MITLTLPAWSRTLKFKIVALTVAAAALSTVGATHVVLRSTQADVERMLLRAHSRDREQTAGLLASKLDPLLTSLGAVTRQLQPAVWNDPAALTETLRDNAAINAMFDAVFAARTDGKMIVRIDRGRPVAEMISVADREYFQRVMQSDQAVISKPILGKVSKAPLLVIVMPVLGTDGRALGAIGGTLALGSNQLFASLNATGHNEGSRELVLDRDGVVLAHPDPSRLLGRAVDEPGLGAVVGEWLQQGSPIDTTGQASFAQGHLVSLAGIPYTDWVLVRLTPAEQGLQPLAAARRTAWLAAVSVALIAGLLSGSLAWLMIRPISQLRLRAQRMLGQAGPVDEPWPRASGEVGALGRAFREVVEQGRARQAEVQALLQRLEAVLDYADVGIALSRDGHFELVSRQFCHVFRCEKTHVIGQPTSSIHASDAAYQALADRAHPAFMTHGAFDGELELMRSDGNLFWAHMRGRAVAPGDRSKGTIWIIEDVTEAHAQRERLVWTASHDALTGLKNRRAFEAELGEATARSALQPFCALFIDLDRFKQVNDTGGHAAGDALLRDIAQLLADQVRKSDTVARLGGDEFAVLLNHCPVPQAQVIAEKIRHAVVEYRLVWEGGASFSVGTSIGLLPVHGAFGGAAAVLRAADAACYAAKRQGRNCVVLGSAHGVEERGEGAAPSAAPAGTAVAAGASVEPRVRAARAPAEALES